MADRHAKSAASKTNRGDAITRYVRFWNTTSLSNVARLASEEQTKCTRNWIQGKLRESRTYKLNRQLGIRKAFKPPKGPSKALSSAFCQLASGHSLTATHLKRIGRRDTDTCWFCNRDRMTRGHLFGSCSALRDNWNWLVFQARGIWMEVKKRRKKSWTAKELFSYDCFTPILLQYIKDTKIGLFAAVESAKEE